MGMRIAMLGWEFPPFISGGLGVHCYELTRQLVRLGVEIDFFMPVTGSAVVSGFPGLRIIQVAKTSLQPYMSFSKASQRATFGDNLISAVNEYWGKCEANVLELAGQEPYDLIHAHDWLASRPGITLKSSLCIPFVQTFHSTEFDRTSWPWDYILDVERQAAEGADLIIAVSKRTKQAVMRLGADGRKIRIVYNGVDQERFSRCHVEAGTIQRFKRGRKVVLFLGRLTEQKGPVQFLHAARMILDAEPDTLFVIAGKGELLPLLINMSMQLGIAKNVRFLGYVPDEDQKRIYKVADVYVMPSTSEPFGITALEAMSSGVPVIVSKTSGVAEIAKSALQVDFWDIRMMAQKILAVLRYPPLSRTMNEMSARESSQFSWGRTADETVKVYSEAISIRRKAIESLNR